MKLLLLPTQLFHDLPQLLSKQKISEVIVYEEPKFFTAHKYHKLKLVYHRASCMHYAKWLESLGIKCQYIEYNRSSPTPTHIIDPIDHELSAKYKKKYPGLIILPSMHFTLTAKEAKDNAAKFKSAKGKFSHELFYKWQRRRLSILMKGDQPEGGRWSFDTENRQSMPTTESPPAVFAERFPEKSSGLNATEIIAAKQYIAKHFSANYGEMNLVYPCTHTAAKKWLSKFVKERLKKFGKYEDASREGSAFLYHSALTPMLNIGLLTDWDVLDEVMAHRRGVPLAALEGFIRQLIGWRNYMYCVYLLAPEIQKQNYFGAHRKLNKKWWTGTTGIAPIDDIIKNKIIKYAYTHHIERLMYLGAFMLMLGVAPLQVYNIFMEWTIDAYDWVMIPNIYGMSQFADGGRVMKRPYFSSSNYILKMSNYKRGTWCAEWDAIYYAFLSRHRSIFAKNYFYAGQIHNWTSKTATQRQDIQKRAAQIAASLTSIKK